MNRRSVIRCILGLTAAPKILAEINLNPKTCTVGPTTKLFSELNFAVPDYMPRLIEKYGSTSWMSFSDELNKITEYEANKKRSNTEG